jgi:hypothetical protein
MGASGSEQGGSVSRADSTEAKQGSRCTQLEHLCGRTDDDVGARHDKADGSRRRTPTSALGKADGSQWRTPTSAHGRSKARGRLRTTQPGSSPPCGSPGVPLAGGRAVTAEIEGSGWLGFRRRRRLGSARLIGFGGKQCGRDVGFIGTGGGLGMWAHGMEHARAQSAARPGSGSSWSGSGGWRTGMTTGTPPSATEGGGQDAAALGRC